ncbi:MAG: DUF2919 family protein [Paraglaciecola sp.]|uniref:DUF2919 family protein n=1 Tax=Paraglaciecola sp. TaxID=1920173 RepID=UPI00329919F9
MKLLLPLKFYDASGRVIPSLSLYLCLLYLSRSFLIFIASLSGRDSSDTLLRIFYPETNFLYISLAIGLPTLAVLVIVGFREKIWRNHKTWLFGFVKPCIIASVTGDLSFNLMLAKLNNWQFSWVIAVTTLVSFFCLYFILKDNHIRLMLLDWKKG